MGSNAEDFSDSMEKNLVNITTIGDQSISRQVKFDDMVRAFIKGKAFHQIVDLEQLKIAVNRRSDEFDQIFEREVRTAADFCSLVPCPSTLATQGIDPEPKRRCEEIKYYLNQYCSNAKKENRYLSLVKALNNILRWKDDQSNPELIFVVNDPVIIRTAHMHAKRKPDIILVKLETFKSWFQGCEDLTFDECQTLIAKGKKRTTTAVKPLWSDVIQFWELCEKVPDAKMENFEVDDMIKFSSNQDPMDASIDQNQSSVMKTQISSARPNQNQGSATNVKRKCEDNQSGPNKRVRSSQPTTGTATEASIEMTPVAPDVQCAYYAIESFRSSWKVSHVSGILLQDTDLSVLWYDPQGCLRSFPIDIVKDLPLLLVLISVQIHSNFLSGFHDIDPEVLKAYDFGKLAGPSFRLTGRMTRHAILTLRSFNSPPKSKKETQKSSNRVPDNNRVNTTPAVDEYFFKVSWVEDEKEKEADIVDCARKRAEEHLPAYYRNYVLNHLPDIKHSSSEQVLDTCSCTGIFRVLANQPTTGSRSQYWIVSKKLKSLAFIVHEFDKFKRIYMELIRCHRLLWTIGIAHGDISFSNLMYDETSEGLRGILNDFDLAETMPPGALSPPQMGFTGTTIFMALELLMDEALEKVSRLYQHDLESFAWVLLYACICVDLDGQEHLDRSPINSWIQADRPAVCEKKWTFFGHLKRDWNKTLTPVLHNYRELVHETFEVWDNATRRSVKKPRIPNCILLRDALSPWKWPEEELDWVAFQVEMKSNSQAELTTPI